MLSPILKALGCLLLAAATCTPRASAQPAAPDPGSNPRSVDATQFGERITLGPNWLFAPGDNPAWASPTFDDSGWRVVSAKMQLPAYGIRDIRHGWYRAHIHLRPDARNVMVGIQRVLGSYDLYANGVRIGGFRPATPRERFAQLRLRAFSVPDGLVAHDGNLLLALRFSINAVGSAGAGTSTPIHQMSQISLMSRESAPREMSYVDAHNTATMWVLASLSLLIGLVAIALFGALRQKREYLACAIFLFAESAFCFSILWEDLHVSQVVSRCVIVGFLGIINFALIEFVRLVLGLRRSRWLLGLEVLSFVSVFASPLGEFAGLIPFYLGFGIYYFPVMIILVLLPVLLVQAILRGNREAWVLLPAVLLRGLTEYWDFFRFLAYYTHITNTLQSIPTLHLGSYQAGVRDPGGFIFFITILLFLVLRTVGIVRERAQAAAELEAARTVQQVLIPDDVPAIPGFTIQSVYKPAGQVGGDFFQILPTQSGGVLVVIGDVSGKGMPAAMTVSLLVGTFRTLAHYTQNPGEILAAMNTRMLHRSHGGFTTCLVLRADPDGKLTVANAGHIAPYLDGKELPLENGLPLGLAAESTYIESTFQLAAGQQLSLVTDGVVEARDKTGALFGFERTAAISIQTADQIAKTAELFGQDDDITALTLERTALA